MEDFFFICPFCQQEIKAKTSWRGQTAECPFCKESCVVPDKTEPSVPSSGRFPEREYKVVILEVAAAPEMTRQLNLYVREGWRVISQSTIFISETSAGLMGLGGGTKQEGILYTLEREK